MPVFLSLLSLHTTSYRILKSSNPRTLRNDPTRKGTQGAKNIITPEQIREKEKILENEDLEGLSLILAKLGFEAQVETSKATIRWAMGILDYDKCLACQRS